MRGKKQVLLSVAEVAARLGVSRTTVARWIKANRLPAVRKTVRIVRTISYVPAAAITSAFQVRCLNCGSAFKAKRPQKASFCSVKCRNRYAYLLRTGQLDAGRTG